MRSPSFIAWLAGAAALLALCLPSAALAGTYGWDLPANFTATAPGANPDHDAYGGTPWSYAESDPSLGHDPTSFSLLSTFSTNVAATGLTGWGGPSGPSVAINPTSHASTNGTATYPAGQLVLQPAGDRFAAVGWTSPLTGTVQVSGTITQDDAGSLTCPYSTVWTVDLAGAAGSIASGSLSTLLPGPGTFSQSVNVVQGQSIDLTVSNTVVGNPACDATGVSLHVAATGTSPQVTLDSPGAGALIGSAEPAFSGSAGQGFGASGTVTVRVYGANSTSGTPIQTLTGTRSGGSYSVTPSAPLPDGVYTAQAEQDDSASPPDAGFSTAVEFTVHHGSPAISLSSLGSKPLLTSTPTFTGVAGAAPGDARTVGLAIYPGGGTTEGSVRFITGPTDGAGHFSVRVTPGLDDGRYTAVAVQAGSATTAFSAPATFRVKVHGPAVTLDQPASGTTTGDGHPQLSGAAGNRLGDSTLVSVFLYPGANTAGRRLGSVRLRRTGPKWSGRFPLRLAPGRYTARAVQTDDAGHTSLSRAVTFQVVPPATTIGATVALSGNSVTIPITCLAPPGAVCTGDVLILTVRSFQAVAGGPVGKLRLLFAYVSIPGGGRLVVKRTLPAGVAGTIRDAKTVQVRVTASLSQSGANPKMSDALRSVTIER